MPLAVSFTQTPGPTLQEVGGKGLSLIKMTQAGLAIPPGFVLTVAFFAPWFQLLKSVEAWNAFVNSSEDAALKQACEQLKAAVADFRMTDNQRAALDQALTAFPEGTLFAVRSSSPEEDLEGSSFAGGYETVLGVTMSAIDTAVRRAFASCLDVRVAIYKREHGFDMHAPSIAVVVQQQIASDVAGVGFSLNPITNAYDEACLSSNWGLGETVVSGIASPDYFVIDKVSRRILKKDLGKKETSIWLTATGGTQENPDARHDQFSLTDEQALRLTDALLDVERVYGKPMDIEWAFADDTLFLLQARPITTHLELPPDLITEPGKKKRLYWDVTISVQGLFKPMSVMASGVLAQVFRQIPINIFGRDLLSDIETTIPYAGHGRLYLNLSNLFPLVQKDTIVKLLPAMDPLAAASLAVADEDEYRAAEAYFKRVPWRILLDAPFLATHVSKAWLFPDRVRRQVDAQAEALIGEFKALRGQQVSTERFFSFIALRVFKAVFQTLLPCFLLSKLAMKKIRQMFQSASDEQQKLIAKLDQSLPGNVTVDMGLALAKMAILVPKGITVEALDRSLRQRTAPEPLLSSWNYFIDRYGHRGVGELDIANPRYRDDPRMLLQQMIELSSVPEDHSPMAIVNRSRAERQVAFETLLEQAKSQGRRFAKRFTSLYRVVENLGGLRETPKFLMMVVTDVTRYRLMQEAETLVAAGRLSDRSQIFDLIPTDLMEAEQNPGLDLRARAAERRAIIAKLARFKELPRIVDSRGRIFRPAPRQLKPGEVAGYPVSPGIVKGRVKVLHTPDEKPLLAGEILVARATDPGWTPLFVNAAAVVLEVGGVMQHGALVAREYGKPCVSGVEGATERLKDGMLVEVDGASGIVRIELEPST